MSVSLGAENKTVLELFSYYHQVHEWKYKAKRRFNKNRTGRKLSEPGVQSPERTIKRRFRRKKDDDVETGGHSETPRTRRCKSMIELGDGSIANIGFYERAGEDGASESPRKPIQRSTSFKEKVFHRAGNLSLSFSLIHIEYFLFLFVVLYIPILGVFLR